MGSFGKMQAVSVGGVDCEESSGEMATFVQVRVVGHEGKKKYV